MAQLASSTKQDFGEGLPTDRAPPGPDSDGGLYEHVAVASPPVQEALITQIPDGRQEHLVAARVLLGDTSPHVSGVGDVVSHGNRATYQAAGSPMHPNDPNLLSLETETQQHVQYVQQVDADTPLVLNLGIVANLVSANLVVNQDAIEYPSDVMRKLGAGSFGDVYLCELDGAPAAIKELKGTELYKPQFREDFQREVQILSMVRSTRVVQLLGVRLGPTPAILTKYYPRGNLQRLIHRSDSFQRKPLRRRLTIAKDVASGMQHLHTRNPPVLHLDLKSENVLIDADWSAAVCDLGLSRLMEGPHVIASAYGTLQYRAPELLAGVGACTEKADVYSFALVLYELVTGRQPWSELIPAQISYQVRNMSRPNLPKGVDREVVSLIEECWAQEAQTRPSFRDILSRIRSMLQRQDSGLERMVPPTGDSDDNDDAQAARVEKGPVAFGTQEKSPAPLMASPFACKASQAPPMTSPFGQKVSPDTPIASPFAQKPSQVSAVMPSLAQGPSPATPMTSPFAQMSSPQANPTLAQSASPAEPMLSPFACMTTSFAERTEETASYEYREDLSQDTGAQDVLPFPGRPTKGPSGEHAEVPLSDSGTPSPFPGFEHLDFQSFFPSRTEAGQHHADRAQPQMIVAVAGSSEDVDEMQLIGSPVLGAEESEGHWNS